MSLVLPGEDLFERDRFNVLSELVDGSDRLIHFRSALTLDRHEPGDRLIATGNNKVLAGFDFGEEFREAGVGLTDCD